MSSVGDVVESNGLVFGPQRFGTGLHLIDRYHCVDVDEFSRSIDCECGWEGHEDLFAAHRRAMGQTKKGHLSKAVLEQEEVA
jgi:hypothetical protein